MPTGYKASILSCCLGWGSYGASKVAGSETETVLLLLLSLLFFAMAPLFVVQARLEAKRP